MLSKFLKNSPFDKLVVYILMLISLTIITLLIVGDQTKPHPIAVEMISSPTEQHQLIIDFNRVMDRKSVEENFVLEPALSGQVSWKGKTMIFNPDKPFPYNSELHITINKNAQDENGKLMQNDFTKKFNTPSLHIAYIGTEKEEKGKLILSDLKGEKKEEVKGDIIIESYKISPDGKKIYLIGQKKDTATVWNELFVYHITEKKLEQITKDEKFIHKSIQLSPDGTLIAVPRIEVTADGEYISHIETWIASTNNYNFQKFADGKARGTEIFFSPDNKLLLYKNKNDNFELTEIYPDNLKDNEKNNSVIGSDESLFIGNYMNSYGFHPYKPLIIFTETDEKDPLNNYNKLVLFQNDGTKEEVPLGIGTARDTVFLADGKKLVTIFSQTNEQFTDKDAALPLSIFHLYSYDLEQKTIEPLTNDFEYSESDLQASADARYLLFLRYDTLGDNLVVDPAYQEIAQSLNEEKKGAEIWLMKIEDKTMTKLPLKGLDISFFSF